MKESYLPLSQLNNSKLEMKSAGHDVILYLRKCLVRGVRRVPPVASGALLLCLTGCATAPAYPPQWPALAPAPAKSAEYAPIAGRYADKGVIFSTDGESLGEVSLTEVLHEHDRPPFLAAFSPRRERLFLHHIQSLTNAAVVVVAGPKVEKSWYGLRNNLYDVQSWHGQTLLATSQMKQVGRLYYSLNGFDSFLLNSGGENFGTLGGESSEDLLLLRKATDGSLIALRHNIGGGFLLIIPFWWRENVWYRFPPVGDVTTPLKSWTPK